MCGIYIWCWCEYEIGQLKLCGVVPGAVQCMHTCECTRTNESLMIDQLCMGYARQGKDHISRVDDRLLTRASENGETFIVWRKIYDSFSYCVMMLKLVKFEMQVLSRKTEKIIETLIIHYCEDTWRLLSWQHSKNPNCNFKFLYKFWDFWILFFIFYFL